MKTLHWVSDSSDDDLRAICEDLSERAIVIDLKPIDKSLRPHIAQFAMIECASVGKSLQAQGLDEHLHAGFRRAWDLASHNLLSAELICSACDEVNREPDKYNIRMLSEPELNSVKMALLTCVLPAIHNEITNPVEVFAMAASATQASGPNRSTALYMDVAPRGMVM